MERLEDNMKRAFILAFIVVLFIQRSWAGKLELPSFLPEYYSAALQIDERYMNLINHSTTNTVERWMYATEDESMGLSIEFIKCDRPRGRAVFNNIIEYINKQPVDHKGQFLEVTETELHAKVLEPNLEMTIFSYILPKGVQIWTFSKQRGSIHSFQDRFSAIKSMVDRQRYAQALVEGNVSMGNWGPQIHEYASVLLQEGNRQEGLLVFKNLLATSPYNYQAHLDLAANTHDHAEVSSSARIVFENAENSDLLTKAAKLLGEAPPELESVPILSKKETGLQVILIPLPPCSPWFLDGIAKTYETMTGIPVIIRRLKETWGWSEPDRIPHQRTVQGILVQEKKADIDFNNWTKAQYVEALRGSVATNDALSKYYVKDLITKIENNPGQYFVEPYLERLRKMLREYRSKDNRTMYVGITEANIYSGDNNYVFSLGGSKGESLASILSYHMMLSSTLQENYESRQRLIERIAKELVPASLKQLDIPRSTDPRCPYSYSDGVSRLDDKTLQLSAPIKDALAKLKIRPEDSGDKK